MIFKTTFFVFLCVVCGVVRSDLLEDMIQWEDTCLIQYPTLNADILLTIRQNLKDLDKYYKEHADLYCFTKCLMQGVGAYSADGKILPDKMSDVVHLAAEMEGVDDSKSLVRDAIEKCSMEAGSDDHCEKIGHYFVCKIAALDGIKLKKEFCPKCYD